MARYCDVADDVLYLPPTSRGRPDAALVSHFEIALMPLSSRLRSAFQPFDISARFDLSASSSWSAKDRWVHQVVPIDRLSPREAFPKKDAPTSAGECEFIEERRAHAVPQLGCAVLHDPDVERRPLRSCPTQVAHHSSDTVAAPA